MKPYTWNSMIHHLMFSHELFLSVSEVVSHTHTQTHTRNTVHLLKQSKGRQIHSAPWCSKTNKTNKWMMSFTYRYDIFMKSSINAPSCSGWPSLKVLMTQHLPGTEELGKLFECSISFLAQRFFIQCGVAVEIIIKLRPNASDSVLSRYVLSILYCGPIYDSKVGRK